MFADAITDPAVQEAASAPWWVWALTAVAVLGVTVWVVLRLHQTVRDGWSIRDVLPRVVASVRSARPRPAAAVTVPRPRPAAAPSVPPVPPAPDPVAPVEPPQAAPVEAAGPPTASRLKGLIVAASIPSTFSLVWTVWTFIDMLTAPLPAALAAGLVLDVALVAAVAIGFLVPDRATPAKIAGWIIAALAAVIVGWHSMTLMTVLVLLGAIPLASKALWHLALDAYLTQRRQLAAWHARQEDEARAAREREAEEARQRKEAELAAEEERKRREEELSSDLDHKQQVLIAKKQKEAEFARRMAAAELELEMAKSEAEHKAALAKIRRLGEQQRAMDKESAEVEKGRQQLIREIKAGEGIDFAVEAARPARRALGRPDDPTDGPDGPGGGKPVEDVWFPEPTDVQWERHGQPTARPTADPIPVGQSVDARPTADLPPFLWPDAAPTPDPTPAPGPSVDVPRDDDALLERVHALVMSGELPLVLTREQRAAGQVVPDRPAAESLRNAVGCGQVRSRRLRDAYPDYATGRENTWGAA